MSHEFIILATTGESEVYCHRDYLDFEIPEAGVNFDDADAMQRIVDVWTSRYAATSEKHEPDVFEALPGDARMSARGIEVGHIFHFGTKYSAPMKAVVAGPDGGEHPVHMGSYGIGPSRLVAAIIEANHDETGIKWPEAVAPFKVAVLNLEAGRQRDRRGERDGLSPAHGEGRRGALQRPRRASRLEIRVDRPDRHSLADPGRSARASPKARSSSNAAPTEPAS